MSGFYEFDQNNTGGSFVHDPAAGIGVKVYIEADSEREACAKAESIGIYFNGCATGEDCPCCGDRWYRPNDPTEFPQRYGVRLVACSEGESPDLYWGIPDYIHFANGTFRPVKATGGSA